MICYIYRSIKKPDTYLYLGEKDKFDQLPESVINIFGPPEYSMSINLTPERVLAQEDTREVLHKIKSEGFYLQLPRTGYDIEKKLSDLCNQ